MSMARAKKKGTCLSVHVRVDDTLEIKVRARGAKFRSVALRCALFRYLLLRNVVPSSFSPSGDIVSEENGDSGFIARGRK